MRKAIVALLVMAPAVNAQSTLPLKYSGKPTTPAITAADLMTRLYIFADDSMMGRETGTKGHLMSTAYIANEVKRFGLEPGGDNGTFFQDVPAFVRDLDREKSSISRSWISGEARA